MKKTLLTLIVAQTFIAQMGFAQNDDEAMGDVSLQDLLDIKVTVASGSKGMTLRESPGIVTLITEEEIVNSGARDLIDVLNLVPGFSFAMDVQGIVGIAARGNWSHEGKILLLVDGQEFNELSFATLQFGNHFPVENIERIEIIRGPGSAIYGGFAEMGVIKIITKTANTFKGVEGSMLMSRMKQGEGRKSLSVATANTFDGGQFNANVFYSRGNRSDRDFSDFYGDTYNLEGNSDLDSLMLNVGGQYGGFSTRLLLDHYDVRQRDIFYVNAPFAVKESFDSHFLELKYLWQINDQWSLEPVFNLKKQKPWRSDSQQVIDLEIDFPDTAGQFFSQDVQRNTAKITASYNANDTDNITFGASHFVDKDSTANLEYDNTALFAQGLFGTAYGNVTLGARFVDHSEAGTNFLPRLGYTNIWGKYHLKVLWSKAFRAPVMQNIVDFKDPLGKQTAIKPENTTVLEVEAGAQVSNNLFVTANVYDITIDDPIVYYFDSQDAYRNYPKVGTRGFELEARFKRKWGYLTASYSMYQVSDNKVDQYAVRAVDSNLEDDNIELLNEDELTGIPKQKIALNASYQLSDNWTLNGSLVYESGKYAYVAVTPDDDEQLIARRLSSTTQLNLNLIRHHFLAEKNSLHLGVFNLLNDDVDYVQPYYDGYHAPYPGPSREIFVEFRWAW